MYFHIASSLLLGCFVLFYSSHVQAFQDPVDSTKNLSAEDLQQIENINQMTVAFFEGWKNGEAATCRDQFYSKKVPVVHLTYVPNKRRHVNINNVAAEEMMNNLAKAPPKFLKLKSKQTDLLGENFAVCKAVFLKSGKKGFAVFTYGRENDSWKIISLTFEERFNW